VTTKTGSWLFGRLAQTLHPDHASAGERRYLRSLLDRGAHEQRGELARLLASIGEAAVEQYESQALASIRSRCSAELGAIVDAVVAYEEFARVVGAVFRTLCFVSRSQGTRPMTPLDAAKHRTVARGAKELPGLYERTIERMARIDAVGVMELDLGELAIKRSPSELVEVVMQHHEAVQARKPPNGKRPWFEPLRDGWVVRRPYGSPDEPEIGASFVHPIRVAALRRFLEDSAP
jgi:hypothetical protein